MSGIKTHKDLDVWKEAIALAKEVYKLTETFPKEEIYGLTSQIRRAAVSIPSNIGEGAARNSRKEFIQALHVSLGSLAELETQLLLAKEIGFLQKNPSPITDHPSPITHHRPGCKHCADKKNATRPAKTPERQILMNSSPITHHRLRITHHSSPITAQERERPELLECRG